MSVVNTVRLRKDYAIVTVEGKNYVHNVLLDIEDLQRVGEMRISNTGYAYQTCEYAMSVANVVMRRLADRSTVVDHINTNRLDNRKKNLRIVSQKENTQARKTFVRNNTGVVGISYRENGKYAYYRVTLTDPRTNARFNKQFNINKLGKTRAFERATVCLAQKKTEFGYLI